MGQVRCIVPITVRLAGRPGPRELEALTEAVARAVSGRLAAAGERLSGDTGLGGLGGVFEAAGGPRSPWDAARFDAAASTYTLPSYNGGGQPTAVRVTGTAAEGSVVRIDVYITEGFVVVVRDGSRAPLVFRLRSTDLVPGVSYEWSWTAEGHVLNAGTRGQKVVRFRGSQTDLDRFEALMRARPKPAPARVLESAAVLPSTPGGATPSDSQGSAPKAGTEKGEGTGVAWAGDFTVFAKDPALAGLYLDFLARYGGVDLPRKQAEAGLSKERVQEIIRGKPRATAVTLFFTQGWKEWTAAGGSEKTGFAVLEETLLTQWQRGNSTVLGNELEVSKDSQGFGLFRRGGPIKLYDELGLPIPSAGGGYKDSGFRAAAPPEFALQIELPPGLYQVLRAVQQTAVDEPVLVYKAARAYVDNGDLVWPALRDGWDGWSAIEKELQRQIPVLIAFLAGHTVALALKRSGSPWGVAVGTAIDGILWAVGKAFQIVFIGQLLFLAYKAGGELSLVQRPAAGQALDALSQRHLGNAIVILRELLVQVVAAGLTAGLLKAARETALLLPPPGGSGGPAPAFAVAASGRGGPGGQGGAAAAAGLPPELPSFRPAPAQMSSLKETGQETGAQLEKKELQFHQQTKAPTSARYFSRQRVRFSRLIEDLKAYAASQVKAGNVDPVGTLNEAVLSQNTQKFLDSRPNLKTFWDMRSQALARRLVSLNQELSRLSLKDGGRKPIERQIEETQALIDEMNAFEKGEVGAKEMDLFELWPTERRIVVTDITQKVSDPFHNFKTEFYVEVLKALTGWSEVYGLEFKDVRQQKVIP